MTKHLISRRAFSGMMLSAPALMASGLSLRAQSLKEISYITPFGHSSVYAPEYVAVTEGYFEKHGLKVNLIAGSGSSVAVQQLLAGQVQVSRAGGIDVVRAVATGNAQIRSFGTISHTSTWWIISGKDKPVAGPQDLKGKTVGIVSAGGGSEATIDIMLASAGVNKSDLTLQVVGNSPGSLDLVKLGRLDAFIADQSVYAPLLAAGAEMTAFSVDPYVAIPGQVYMAAQTMIDAEPETLVSFMKAIRDAVAFIAADTDASKTIAAMKPFAFPELDSPDLVKHTLQAELKLWQARGAEGVGKVYPDVWIKGTEQIGAANLAKLSDPSLAYTTLISDKL